MTTKLTLVKTLCPRCHKPMTQELYGPCSRCRAELRANAETAGERTRAVCADWLQRKADNEAYALAAALASQAMVAKARKQWAR